MIYAGIDLGGTTIKAALVTENGEILCKKSIPTGAERNNRAIIEDMAALVKELVEEQGFSGAESTVRNKVKELKGEIPKAFVPLQFDPGDTLQVDWGEATVYVADTRMNINIFCARLCYSYAD